MPFTPAELLAKLGVKDVTGVLLDCKAVEERALEALKTDNLARGNYGSDSTPVNSFFITLEHFSGR